MAPSDKNQRIVPVDALRGFALLGILFAHFIFWYSGAGLPPDIYNKYKDAGSQAAVIINSVLIFGKFFTFFSFLFGLSFYLQMQSMEKKEHHFFARYAWRLIILGGIGLLHHALWRGDILSIYVPLGFILLFIRKISDRFLAVLAILLVLNLPVRVMEIFHFFNSQPVPPAPATGTPPVDPEVQRYYDIIKKGSFPEMIKDNWSALRSKFVFQLESGRIYITLGFFLLGMYAGRKQWFKNLQEARPVFRKICKISGWVSLAILLLLIAITVLVMVKGIKPEEHPLLQLAGPLFFDLVNTTLTLFYISGLTLLMYRVKWQKILFPFSYIGRMALTSYLSQTFFGLLLFYHVGLGLFLKTSPGLNFLLVIPVFVLQALLARWWFRHFNYGPVEWLWRSFTFFRWQPMKRKGVPVTD